VRYGNPWEIRRPQACVEVGFGGHTQSWADSFGEYKVLWTPAEVVKGVPYDTPILGYRSGVANTLRLWRSEATESFYFDRFNSGVDCQDHVGKTYLDQEAWSKMSIYNAARMSKFSSDRSIRDYCKDIWKITRFEVAAEQTLTRE
jgi:glucan phosphorylase